MVFCPAGHSCTSILYLYITIQCISMTQVQVHTQVTLIIRCTITATHGLNNNTLISSNKQSFIIIEQSVWYPDKTVLTISTDFSQNSISRHNKIIISSVWFLTCLATDGLTTFWGLTMALKKSMIHNRFTLFYKVLTW